MPVKTGFQLFALRDLLIGATTLGCWALGAHEITTGVLSGLCALLFHEWGHLFGANKSGAVVKPAPWWSPFLFDLSSSRNTGKQFLVTSCWGFTATGIFLIGFWLVLPEARLASQIALGIALFLATLTVVIEFPIAWRVYRGHAIPRVEIFERGGEHGGTE